jgi:two-component system, sensor histidine kinase LadS
MIKSVIITAFALLLSFANAAQADQAVITDQAYAEDTTAKLDFAQARKLPLTPFTGTLLKGYTASAIWVRIRVSTTRTNEPLFLTSDPQFIDEIALHNSREPRAPPAISGDRHPDPKAELPWNGNIIRLPQQSTTQEYWLRVRSTSAMILKLEAIHRDELPNRYIAVNRMQDTYTGILLVILLMVAGILIQQRGERVLLAFFLQQLTSLLMSLSYFGYLRKWFADWPHAHWFDFTTSFLIIAITAATIHFHQALLASNWRSEKHLTPLKMLRLPVAICFALLLCGYAQPALQLNMIIVQVGPFILFAIATSMPRKLAGLTPPILPRKVIIAYYGLLLLMMSAISLSTIGILQIGMLIDYRIVTLLSVFLVLSLLRLRSLRSQHLENQRRMRARWLRQQMHSEKNRIEEQKSFASILTHEVKNPLSVLSLASAMPGQAAQLQSYTEKAVLEISTLIDRFASLQKQDSAEAKPVHACAFDVLLEIESMRTDKGATRMKLSGKSPPGFATDKALFRIIIGNLMENAIKYGNGQRPIDIRVTTQRRGSKQGIAIEFTNAVGKAGFPDPNKLFTQFYRAPSAREQSGSGLGLHMVKGLIRTLGGTIEYLPSPRRIRFRIWLPHLA